MTASYGQHALVADEFQLTTEDRIRLGLEQPNHPHALSQGKIGKVAVNRIRYALGELAALNIDNVNEWLQQVARDSPSRAIELFIQLAEFSVPKLKAVAVDVRSSDGSVKTVSTAELHKIVSEQ